MCMFTVSRCKTLVCACQWCFCVLVAVLPFTGVNHLVSSRFRQLQETKARKVSCQSRIALIICFNISALSSNSLSFCLNSRDLSENIKHLSSRVCAACTLLCAGSELSAHICTSAFIPACAAAVSRAAVADMLPAVAASSCRLNSVFCNRL